MQKHARKRGGEAGKVERICPREESYAVGEELLVKAEGGNGLTEREEEC